MSVVRICDGLRFYAVLDLHSPPKMLTRNDNASSYHVNMMLPLPTYIVVFSLGRWKYHYVEDTELKAEIVLSHKNGTETLLLGHLSDKNRCLIWNDTWNPSVLQSKDKDDIRVKLKLTVQDYFYEEHTRTMTEVKLCEKDGQTQQEITFTVPNGGAAQPTLTRKEKKRKLQDDSTLIGPNSNKRTSSTRTRTLKKYFESPASKILASIVKSPTEIDGEDEEEEIKQENEIDDNADDVDTEKESSVNTSITASPSKEQIIQKHAKPCVKRGPQPTPRWGHSMCLVSEDKVVLIGGQGDKQQLCKDSVWELSIDRKHWTAPETSASGVKPETRMGHTASYDPAMRCIYVFGGSKNLRWYSDVHVLDLDEWKWQLIKTNGKAPTRAYHSATLYRHELWIFGGVYPRPDPHPDGCSNAVHIFSPVMESWYDPIVTGEKPAARSGHSATVVNGDQLVMFGGWDAPVCFNDLYILDMSFVEWSQPTVNGTPPTPRSWHDACALTGNRVLIHGGYNGNDALEDSHIFNLDTNTWFSVDIDWGIPARAGHTIFCVPYKHENQDQDEIVIFGGGDNEGAFFNDLFDVNVPFEFAKSVEN